MMRLFFFTIVLTVFSFNMFAQKNEQAKLTREIGLVAAFGNGQFGRNNPLPDEGVYKGVGYFSFGITYMESFSHWFALETDPSFAKYSFKQSHADNSSSIFHVQLITIPAQARLKFLRYFFVNAGLMLDLDLGIIEHGQSGIGALAGVGVQIPLTSKLSIYANPYVQQHGVWLFRGKDNSLRVNNAGVKVGISYKFLK